MSTEEREIPPPNCGKCPIEAACKQRYGDERLGIYGTKWCPLIYWTITDKVTIREDSARAVMKIFSTGIFSE